MTFFKVVRQQQNTRDWLLLPGSESLTPLTVKVCNITFLNIYPNSLLSYYQCFCFFWLPLFQYLSLFYFS